MSNAKLFQCKAGDCQGKTFQSQRGLAVHRGKMHTQFELVEEVINKELEDYFCNRQEDPDVVNHPPHYTFGKFEVVDVLEDWFATEPLLWQVVKYLARAGRKDEMLTDLRKAEFYLKRRIGREEEKNELKEV